MDFFTISFTELYLQLQKPVGLSSQIRITNVMSVKYAEGDDMTTIQRQLGEIKDKKIKTKKFKY